MGLAGRHGGHEHGQSDDSKRNHEMAALYWFSMMFVLAAGFASKLISRFVARKRIERSQLRQSADALISSVNFERWLQVASSILTLSAVDRLGPRWLARLPLKKAVLVAAYAALVACLLTWKAAEHDDDNRLERLGFRAAWVTATQTSMPFLLAARTNPIGLLLGTSYERVNWFHRWASRVFLASATVHGGFFVTEWIAADFFWTELRTVRMVTPGLGAWVVLVWTALSTLRPFRQMRYEFFVVQHILSVVALLVFLLLHVPAHHHFSIWCAVVVFVYDVVTRSLHSVWRNLRLGSSVGSVRYAKQAYASVIDEDMTLVTIKNVGFTWTPGQHVLVWSPTFWKQTPHPFTISNAAPSQSGGSAADVQLTLKTKRGLTKKLNAWARNAENRGSDGYMRLMIAGPFGAMPNWRQYQTLVLIGASTGGAFISPVLEDILAASTPSCVRKISALYVVRQRAHAEVYLQRVSRAAHRAREMGIAVRIQVAVTRSRKSEAYLQDGPVNESRERLMEPESPHGSEGGPGVELERLSTDSLETMSSDREEQLLKEEADLGLDDVYSLDSAHVDETKGRPDVAEFVRGAIRQVSGNAAVAVCAGSAVEAVTRSTVASLRGTMGGQDIYLHVERSDM